MILAYDSDVKILNGLAKKSKIILKKQSAIQELINNSVEADQLKADAGIGPNQSVIDFLNSK